MGQKTLINIYNKILMKTHRTKEKILNHIFKNGKKQVSEKILKNNFKALQKTQKKSHNEVLKQTILNTTPTFRTIKLKRRKSKLEIPAFLSSYKHRTSWGLKYLVNTLTSKTNNLYYKQLKTKIESSLKNEGEIVKLKEDLQKNILQKKKYFKYYRW